MREGREERQDEDWWEKPQAQHHDFLSMSTHSLCLW